MQQVNLFLPIELVESTSNIVEPTQVIPNVPEIPEIHKAIKANNIELFTSLLSLESINKKDNDGITPLMVACITGSFEMVSILCEMAINFNDKCIKKGYTAFM